MIRRFVTKLEFSLTEKAEIAVLGPCGQHCLTTHGERGQWCPCVLQMHNDMGPKEARGTKNFWMRVVCADTREERVALALMGEADW